MSEELVYVFDTRMAETLETLRQKRGLKTTGETIRQAVAMLKIVTEHEQPDGSLTIVDSAGQLIKVKR